MSISQRKKMLISVDGQLENKNDTCEREAENDEDHCSAVRDDKVSEPRCHLTYSWEELCLEKFLALFTPSRFLCDALSPRRRKGPQENTKEIVSFANMLLRATKPKILSHW